AGRLSTEPGRTRGSDGDQARTSGGAAEDSGRRRRGATRSRRLGRDQPALALRRAEVERAAGGACGRGEFDARLRTRGRLPHAVPAAGAGRSRSAAVRPVFGLYGRAAGAGCTSVGGRRRGSTPVLPRSRRGGGAAQDVAVGLGGPEGQEAA